MSNYEQMATRQRKWMLYLLAILAIGALFMPQKSIFLGLLLGSIISLYNLFMLQRKVNDFAEKAVKGQKARGLGAVSRFAAVAFGVILALRYEEHINMIALIIGFMTAYPVMALDFIVASRRR